MAGGRDRVAEFDHFTVTPLIRKEPAAMPADGAAAGVPAEAKSARLSVSSVLPGDSPRIAGEDRDHVRRLAEIEVDLPPIVIHRQTGRVIDGMHRLQAALLRGDANIAVEYFDGTEIEAFIRSVQLNIAHGLPLTYEDREAAALRIIETHALWSDRVIAELAGLSAPTIGALRNRVTESDSQLNTRLGRDGRVRPLDATAGRLRASAVITDRPDLSLRAIARQAGVSVGTARDVRARMGRGEDPVLSRNSRSRKGDDSVRPRSAAADVHPLPGNAVDADYMATLEVLQRDPSLRFTDNGRFLLRLLGMLSIGGGYDPADLAGSIPEHCRDRMTLMARRNSEWWRQVADAIEEGEEG